VRASTDAHESSVGQSHLKAEDIGAGDAVFQATGAAGIGGDVATKGAILVALWIGWIKEPLFLYLLLKHAGDDIRFHDGDEVLIIDFLDPVHPVHAHQDASPYWNAPADITVTGTARGDGDATFIGVAEYRRGFLRRPGGNSNFGKRRREPFITSEFGETGGIGDDTRRSGYQFSKISLERRMRFET